MYLRITNLVTMAEARAACSGRLGGMMGNLVVAILAGRVARRMGSDKTLLRLPDGRSAWEAVASAANEVTTRILLLVDTREHAKQLLQGSTPPFPEVRLDERPGAGPLGALAGALRSAPHTTLLLLAADMPLVRPGILRAMYAAFHEEQAVDPALIVAPVIGGLTQFMPACYDSRLGVEADRLLSEGRRDLRALLESPRSRVHRLVEEDLSQIDPDLRSFAGANTPGEWEAILARAKP